MLHSTTVVNSTANGKANGSVVNNHNHNHNNQQHSSPQSSGASSSSHSISTVVTSVLDHSKKSNNINNNIQERENLRNIIAQWNANRLDLFEISEPNEVSHSQPNPNSYMCLNSCLIIQTFISSFILTLWSHRPSAP